MLAAVAAFSFMDAILKLLSAHYPLMQVAALRGATSLPFTLLPVLLAGRLRDLRPRRWPMHLLRGFLTTLVLVGFIYAVRVLSLANAYSVFLSAPIIVAALSVPLLKERINWRQWLAILAGLGGVLVMLRPSSSGAGMLGALAAPGWVSIEPVHWKWLIAMGLLAAIGQYLLTEAFRSAPPSIVSPFEYTALLWGMGIDRVVWHVLPTARVCCGAGVVIASGLYLVWRERSSGAIEPARQA